MGVPVSTVISIFAVFYNTRIRYYITTKKTSKLTSFLAFLSETFLDLIHRYVVICSCVWVPGLFTVCFLCHILGRFIYILDSSNSSLFTFWSSQLASNSRSNWTGTWTGNSNGTWTDKKSSHFSTAIDIPKCKGYILFYVTITTNKFWNDAEILLN